MIAAGGVDQVDTNDAERFLFLDVLLVEHPHVDDDLRRLRFRRSLKPDSHPAVRFVMPRITPGGHGIGKSEEFRGVTAFGGEPLQQQGIFMIEHRLETLPANVAFAGAVNGVADVHVVSGYGLRDGAGGRAHFEEPTGHFLAGADLGKGPVFGWV